MTVTVRPFSADDLDALIDVYNLARPIEVGQLTAERFWSWFSDPALDPTRDVRVAVDEEGVVGMVGAFPWPARVEEGTIFVVGPSILPSHQGQGIGGALLTALLGELAARYPGAQALTRVTGDNAPAQAFLTGHAGFELDRRFWRLAHDTIGLVPAGAPPVGFTLSHLAPEADHGEAIATYRTIIGTPHPAVHLLDEAELQAWTALGTYDARSFLLARDAGGVLAGICFQTFPIGSTEAVIQFLGVLPAVRGQGVATSLLTRALADAHALGRTRTRLEVSGTDEAVLSLYTRTGFTREGSDAFFRKPL